MKRSRIDLGAEETEEGAKAAKEEESRINWLTGKPYSSRYYEILSKRKLLPVYQYKAELEEKYTNKEEEYREAVQGTEKLEQKLQ